MYYLLEDGTVIDSSKIEKERCFSCGELVTGMEIIDDVLYYLKHDKKCRVGKIIDKTDYIVDVLNNNSKVVLKDGSTYDVFMLNGRLPAIQIFTFDNNGDISIKYRPVANLALDNQIKEFIL